MGMSDRFVELKEIPRAETVKLFNRPEKITSPKFFCHNSAQLTSANQEIYRKIQFRGLYNVRGTFSENDDIQ